MWLCCQTSSTRLSASGQCRDSVISSPMWHRHWQHSRGSHWWPCWAPTEGPWNGLLSTNACWHWGLKKLTLFSFCYLCLEIMFCHLFVCLAARAPRNWQQSICEIVQNDWRCCGLGGFGSFLIKFCLTYLCAVDVMYFVTWTAGSNISTELRVCCLTYSGFIESKVPENVRHWILTFKSSQGRILFSCIWRK